MICILVPQASFRTVGDPPGTGFAMNFPARNNPGIEEQIDGTLLEYLNSLGPVTMGFEAGTRVALSGTS